MSFGLRADLWRPFDSFATWSTRPDVNLRSYIDQYSRINCPTHRWESVASRFRCTGIATKSPTKYSYTCIVAAILLPRDPESWQLWCKLPPVTFASCLLQLPFPFSLFCWGFVHSWEQHHFSSCCLQLLLALALLAFHLFWSSPRLYYSASSFCFPPGVHLKPKLEEAFVELFVWQNKSSTATLNTCIPPCHKLDFPKGSDFSDREGRPMLRYLCKSVKTCSDSLVLELSDRIVAEINVFLRFTLRDIVSGTFIIMFLFNLIL